MHIYILMYVSLSLSLSLSLFFSLVLDRESRLRVRFFDQQNDVPMSHECVYVYVHIYIDIYTHVCIYLNTRIL